MECYTDVGKLVPPVDEEDDAGSEGSEWELRERRERQEEREGGAEALGCGLEGGRGRTPAVPSHPSIHGIGRRGVGDGSRVSFVLSFVNSFGRVYFLWDRPGGGQRGACNEPPPRGLRTGKPGKMYAAMMNIGRTRVPMIKQKTKNPVRDVVGWWYDRLHHRIGMILPGWL